MALDSLVLIAILRSVRLLARTEDAQVQTLVIVTEPVMLDLFVKFLNAFQLARMEELALVQINVTAPQLHQEEEDNKDTTELSVNSPSAILHARTAANAAVPINVPAKALALLVLSVTTMRMSASENKLLATAELPAPTPSVDSNAALVPLGFMDLLT